MAQTFTLASYCLGYFVICFSGYEVTASFEIERGKHDTFQNLLCQTSQPCASDQCQKYRAECVENKCERCRCSKGGMNTFVTLGSKTGNCSKDENIIPESVPRKSFRLEKVNSNRLNQCLTVAETGNNTIFGKNCTSSLNMRWISIEKRGKKFQLMNVMTLQCLEIVEQQSLCDSTKNHSIGQVAMKQCKKRDGQNMVQHNNNLYAKQLCGSKSYYLRLETKQKGEGYPAYSQRSKGEMWFNEDKNRLHLEHIPYRGCYRFQTKPKFMLYLDRKVCHEDPCSYQFSAPVFSDNNNCRINTSESKILYSTALTWQSVSVNIDTPNQFFSIQRKSNDTQMLQVFHKALEKFNGSLFRLAISCGNEMHPEESENQCLLLKFGFLRRKTTNTTPGVKSTTDMYTGEKTITTSISTTVKLKHKNTGGSSINAVAVAVPVSLLAVILVVILFYFVCYRRQKREEKLSKDQAENINNPTYIKPSYEDPSKMYQTPASPGKEEASPAKYEYIDNKNIAKQKQPEPEQKYDYAINTEIPRTNLGTQPNCNSGQPELNYDYAANTDIPRIPLNTKPADELKYDYAINTEIPRINLDTQPKSDNAVDPVTDQTYHTLEETNPPAPYYSTLDDPAADETKSLVTYDIPHSGDPVYNVLEERNDPN